MQNYAFFWILLAVAFGIIEASTTNLTTIWLAISAIILAILSGFGLSIIAQPLVFVAIATVLVALTRPLARRALGKKTVATNADRIISQKGIVTEKIDPVENLGKIKVMGQIWSAKSENDQQIGVGTEVLVKRLEGVRAVVEPIAVKQTV
ncbi:MAG: NfeD family protein [Clostridia bacterium]|nr:NfeD family protein [Clostridia bacterium]